MRDNVFAILPDMFQVDDEKFNEDTTEYCEISIELKRSKLFNSNSSYVWEAIQQSRVSSRSYDHSLLFYKKCIDTNNVIDFSNKTLENIGFDTSIKSVHCPEKIQNETSVFDIVIISALICYILWILYSTFRDIFHRKTDSQKDLNRNIRAFSLKSNISKLLDTNKITGTTKPIQGMRVIIMMIVIFCHLVVHQINGFVENVDFVDRVYSNATLYRMSLIPFHLVQIFFVISGFLLSIQTLEIFEDHKQFTMKHLVILLVNRYIRFIAVILFALLLFCCRTLILYLNGLQNNLIYEQISICRQNWFPTLLLLHNIIPNSICHPGAWYVAADIQVYLLSLLVMYIILRFKIKFSVVGLGIITLFYCLWQGSLIFSKHHRHVFKVAPGYKTVQSFIASSDFIDLYASAMSNLPSYLFGMYLGYCHYNKLQEKIFKSKYRRIWWITAFCILTLVSELSVMDLYGLIGAIIGPPIKPLFGVGVGMIIFGIIHDGEGFIKSICQSRLFLIMSSITYSTYVTHFGVVFMRNLGSLVHLSFSRVFITYLEDIQWSLLVGLLIYLCIELPVYNLQKIYIPQIPKKLKK